MPSWGSEILSWAYFFKSLSIKIQFWTTELDEVGVAYFDGAFGFRFFVSSHYFPLAIFKIHEPVFGNLKSGWSQFNITGMKIVQKDFVHLALFWDIETVDRFDLFHNGLS